MLARPYGLEIIRSHWARRPQNAHRPPRNLDASEQTGECAFQMAVAAAVQFDRIRSPAAARPLVVTKLHFELQCQLAFVGRRVADQAKVQAFGAFVGQAPSLRPQPVVDFGVNNQVLSAFFW